MNEKQSLDKKITYDLYKIGFEDETPVAGITVDDLKQALHDLKDKQHMILTRLLVKFNKNMLGNMEIRIARQEIKDSIINEFGEGLVE